jgi:hypothetical protein
MNLAAGILAGASALLMGGALGLAWYEKPGWGWFLFVGLCVGGMAVQGVVAALVR